MKPRLDEHRPNQIWLDSIMIPDTVFHGYLVRVFIKLVGIVSPLSVLFVYYCLASPSVPESTLRDLLFLACLAETLFWGWFYVKQLRAPAYPRNTPSAAMRAKLKRDTLETIGLEEGAWRYFLSGWFTKGDRAVPVEDICKDNMAEWCVTEIFADIGSRGPSLPVHCRTLRETWPGRRSWRKLLAFCVSRRRSTSRA